MDWVAVSALGGLGVICAEAAAFARSGRLRARAPVLVAGAALMLALVLARVQGHVWPVLFALAVGGAAHVADLRARR